MFGTVSYIWYFIGVSEAAMFCSGCDDIPIEAETRSQFRSRRAVVTRRLFPLAGGAPVPLASASRQRSWRTPATIVCIFLDGDVSVAYHDCSSFLVVVVSYQFSKDPAATLINATGHQLVTSSWSVCAEKRAQILEPLMSSKHYRRIVHICSLTCVHRMLDCLQD